MLFSSYFFLLVFLPIVLAGFALLAGAGRRGWALSWVVAASCCFYAWKVPAHLLILLASILINYFLGKLIAESKHASRRKRILVAGVVFNLGLIAVFKYAPLASETLNALGLGAYHWNILLPIGISFFTFQQIAFLVDASQGKVDRFRLLDYSFFVSFFPQLIAGPIVHHREILPQLAGRRWGVRSRNVSIGLSIMVIGLTKKVVLADHFATYASPIFAQADAGVSLTMGQAWLATMAFTFQLYFDFSGYSDMAIGLARLFGIRLPINFHSPYQATSIVDFWRRWHITLSRFLRDYLYIPLGGNRRGKLRRYLNLMATMLLGGLWHGAAWTFVVWGGAHGLMLCINHAWAWLRQRVGLTWIERNRAYRIAMVAITFVSVSVAWALFRAETFDGAGRVVSSMWGANGFSWEVPGVNRRMALVSVLVALFVVWFMPNTQSVMRKFRPAFDAQAFSHLQPPWRSLKLTWRPSFWWAVIIALVATIALVMLDRPSEFIYYQF